jgi:hypothetical protein
MGGTVWIWSSYAGPLAAHKSVLCTHFSAHHCTDAINLLLSYAISPLYLHLGVSECGPGRDRFVRAVTSQRISAPLLVAPVTEFNL